MMQPERAGGPIPVMELIDLHASYGKIDVLHGVDLVVPEGSVVALLGPNGAGKSTTLKVASGQMEPTSGHVHVRGIHVNGMAPQDLAKAGMCTIPEGRGIFANLTVMENLQTMAFAGVGVKGIMDMAFERFPRLGERRQQLAGTLSGGEQQMLSMARALTTDPALLLLDELSMGLAPLIVEELYEIVGELADQGLSILVVEQFARTALAVADYAALMLHGRIVSVGEPADVEEELHMAYLGGTA